MHSSTLVLHGTTNTVLYLQSFPFSHLPALLRDHVLLWVANCLFHKETLDALLDSIRSSRFFAPRGFGLALEMQLLSSQGKVVWPHNLGEWHPRRSRQPR